MKSIPSLTRYLFVALLPLLAACGGGGASPVDPGGDPVPESLAWRAIQRFPTSEALGDIDSFGDVTIAVGSRGAVLTRLGSGAEWKARPQPTDESISKVIMIDEKNAIAIARQAILRTSDAGESWSTVAQTAGSFQDLDVRGGKAVAVGNGTILVSNDRGQTWAPPAGGFPNLSFALVAMHSENTITTYATSRNMFRSTNGGQNWTEVAIAEITKVPSDLEFFSEKFGIASFRNGADIMWTQDGGDTWDVIVNFGIGSIVDLDRVDDQSAFAVLSTGHIHFTENAGKTWAFTSRATVDPLSATAIEVNGNDWDVVGPFGQIVQSRNGGSSWSQISSGRTGTFSDIAVVNALTAFAAFTGGAGEADGGLRTTDGGASWQEVTQVIKRPTRAVFASGVGLFIGGDEISRSTTAGATWVDISPVVAFSLNDAVILDENTFVVCAASGNVLRTVDAGAVWNSVSVPDNGGESFLDIDRFPGTDVLVMVGQSRSFRSTDLGLTWERINVEAQAVAAASADVAVAVGNEILQSADRGQTWTIVESPDQTLRAISFAGSQHAVAVGGNGYMLESLDGGTTWKEVPLQMSSKLGAVTLGDDVLPLVGGTAGVVLLGE